jgi:leader peptidase (prepilin peptidase)/N-methyltransferase
LAPFGLGLIAAILLGWLAGGAANWMADVLPMRGGSGVSGNGRVKLSVPWGALHDLTLPWYLFRRGVCPHCGERRTSRAPLLEAGTILAFVLAWWRFRADPLHLGVVCLYAVFLLAVMVIDLEHRRVLNVMLAPAAGAALFVSLLPGAPDLLQALLGGALGFGVFLLLGLLSRGAIGAGDIKLAGVIGLMVGYPSVVTALLVGVGLGGVVAAILLITRRAGRKSTMAYAPYLSAGAMIVLLLGR